MDNELTPLSNVAFNGALADEINRLMAKIKILTMVGDTMSDWILMDRICNCREDWLCHKCRILDKWENARRD